MARGYSEVKKCFIHMTRPRFDSPEARPYGFYRKGVVDGIPIRMRSPKQRSVRTGVTYLLAHGWATGPSSMRLTATEAVRHGHDVITYQLPNQDLHGALDRNAEATARLIDAFHRRRLRGIGHSEGALNILRGALLSQHSLEVVTGVASAGCVDPDLYTPRNIARCLLAEVTELGAPDLRRDLHVGLKLAAACLQRCTSHPLVTLSELTGLVQANLLDTFWTLAEQTKPGHIRVLPGTNDKLFPYRAVMEAAAQFHPAIEVSSYDGGHCHIMYAPELARRIFQLDDELVLGQAARKLGTVV